MNDHLDTEFEDANDSPGLLLWQVTNKWQAAQRAALRPLELTHVQFVLLASLTYLHVDGPITQKQLAEQTKTNSMMTSQVLRMLEHNGWVRRTDHPTDGRAVALESTKAGVALANKAVKVVEDCDRAFFASLGKDVHAFTSHLKLLR